MNSQKLTNALLLLCVALLAFIAVRVSALPTKAQVDARIKGCEDQIDSRIQHWGQHFGQHFSQH
jgi:hypothetical protein